MNFDFKYSLFRAVMFSVRTTCFGVVLFCVTGVTMSAMRVVGGLFMASGFVVICCFAMLLSGDSRWGYELYGTARRILGRRRIGLPRRGRPEWSVQPLLTLVGRVRPLSDYELSIFLVGRPVCTRNSLDEHSSRAWL